MANEERKRMKDHRDELNDRLRKAKERSKQKKTAEGETKKKSTFLPHPTMFKLETGPRPCTPRQLCCVECGHLMTWRIYSLAADKFDQECPNCGTDARDHWKGKPTQEIDDGTEEEKTRLD